MIARLGMNDMLLRFIPFNATYQADLIIAEHIKDDTE